jgi:hypothetical protein
MDNTMDINLGSENNSMNSLSFIWTAIFQNGNKIEQFDKDGTEHKFKEVQDKLSDLVYFNLKNNSGKMFSINLINGLIGYNRLEFPYIEIEEKKNNIRLIFFRRHTIHMTEAGHPIDHIIIYHLGCQWNDESGQNRQIILKIDEQGNWILGE